MPMMNDQQNHPLHGLGLKNLLTELVEHYGWEILAEQININCFKANTSINSSHKFLHKTKWAREKLEAFYLYKFKQFPLPDDEQYSFAPRNRSVNLSRLSELPAELELGDPEFFDDPVSGPVFPSKKAVEATRAPKYELSPTETRRSKPSSIKPVDTESSNATKAKAEESSATSDEKSSSGDPWAKWRE